MQKNDRRRDSQEYRIQSGRSRVLASNWLCRQGFSCGRAGEGAFGVSLGRKGSTAHETLRQSEGVLGKDWRGRGSRSGLANFYRCWKRRWAVHAPCPKQRVAKPGGEPQYWDNGYAAQIFVYCITTTIMQEVTVINQGVSRAFHWCYQETCTFWRYNFDDYSYRSG